MRSFEYASPSEVQQAVELLGPDWNASEVMAGGTDLLSMMKDDVVHPKRLVNIKQIAGMKGVTFDASGLRVGALTTIQDFADHSDVMRHYPVLAHAASDAASPQIRNMATMGGNLCQRPRCWYFRNGMGLLPKSPDGKSLVREGDNRYHAILGNSGPAYFVSPSSIAPALIAYGARVRIIGPGGAREVPLEKFFVIPKAENEREHNLKPNEVVTDIFVPPPGSGARGGHYEVRQKQAFDWPLATASVLLTISGKTIQSARVVMGHVAPIPWLSAEAAQALVGKTLDEAAANAAGLAAVQNAKGLGKNDYKIQLGRVAVKRAVLAAAKGGA